MSKASSNRNAKMPFKTSKNAAEHHNHQQQTKKSLHHNPVISKPRAMSQNNDQMMTEINKMAKRAKSCSISNSRPSNNSTGVIGKNANSKFKNSQQLVHNQNNGQLGFSHPSDQAMVMDYFYLRLKNPSKQASTILQCRNPATMFQQSENNKENNSYKSNSVFKFNSSSNISSNTSSSALSSSFNDSDTLSYLIEKLSDYYDIMSTKRKDTSANCLHFCPDIIEQQIGYCILNETHKYNTITEKYWEKFTHNVMLHPDNIKIGKHFNVNSATWNQIANDFAKNRELAIQFGAVLQFKLDNTVESLQISAFIFDCFYREKV